MRAIMALKDLISDRTTLPEQVVEGIVKDYVSYHPKDKKIGLTASASRLSNKQKVLVYLVALQGWPFVVDKEVKVPTDARSVDIENELAMRGGTLRPLLSHLLDLHLVINRNQRYSVNSASINEIRSHVVGFSGEDSAPRAQWKKSKFKNEASDANSDKSTGKARRRAVTGSQGSKASVFRKWISDGWFNEDRSLREVHKQFTQKAIFVEIHTLPSYFLSAVRDGLLERRKKQIGNKEVWVYRKKKNT
jgi:hypothetical protein